MDKQPPLTHTGEEALRRFEIARQLAAKTSDDFGSTKEDIQDVQARLDDQIIYEPEESEIDDIVGMDVDEETLPLQTANRRRLPPRSGASPSNYELNRRAQLDTIDEQDETLDQDGNSKALLRELFGENSDEES